MPGKAHLGLEAIADGIQSGKTREPRAYCEGRKANADGALITANPHTDTKAEAFISWDQGWLDKDGALNTDREVGCAAS